MHSARREPIEYVMIIVKRQTELLQIILTLRPTSRLAGLLDRR
jgi:hypothetical protein